jgi:hypothetical protein
MSDNDADGIELHERNIARQYSESERCLTVTEYGREVAAGPRTQSLAGLGKFSKYRAAHFQESLLSIRPATAVPHPLSKW